MYWKKPKTKIFLVPSPYTNGMFLEELTRWKYDATEPRKTFELTDPVTRQKENYEIIDYLGVFKIDTIPDWLARQCVDNVNITGNMLIKLLQKRFPEFRTAKAVLFYQLTVTETNGKK